MKITKVKFLEAILLNTNFLCFFQIKLEHNRVGGEEVVVGGDCSSGDSDEKGGGIWRWLLHVVDRRDAREEDDEDDEDDEGDTGRSET